MKYKSFLLLLLITLFFTATSFECEDNFPDAPAGYETMYLVDYSGLETCGWIFENSNTGENYEPVNLDDFSIYLSNEKKYFVKYDIIEEQISSCMVGQIIHISDIIDPSIE